MPAINQDSLLTIERILKIALMSALYAGVIDLGIYLWMLSHSGENPGYVLIFGLVFVSLVIVFSAIDYSGIHFPRSGQEEIEPVHRPE